MIRNVLVICEGNICRSPMAAALLYSFLEKHDAQINILSAGLHALCGAEADPTAQKLMLQKGLSIKDHRAKQLSNEMILDAELILTMTHKQQKEIENNFPTSSGKVYRLGKWGEFDVIDPYKRPLSVFEHSLALIEAGVTEWCEFFWNIKSTQ